MVMYKIAYLNCTLTVSSNQHIGLLEKNKNFKSIEKDFYGEQSTRIISSSSFFLFFTLRHQENLKWRSNFNILFTMNFKHKIQYSED